MAGQWNAAPPFREDRSSCLSSCLGRLVLFVGVLAVVLGGVYFVFEKPIRQAFDRIDAIGSAVGPGSGNTGGAKPSGPPIVALNLISGTARWIEDLTGDEQGEILAINYDLKKYNAIVLNGADGSLVWEADTGVDTSADLFAARGVILATHERKVRALHGDTGVKLWEAELPDRVSTNGREVVAFDIGDDVVIQSYDNALTSFNKRSGAQNWQVTLKDRYAADLTRLGDLVCLKEYSKENVQQIKCYDLKTGKDDRILPLLAPGQSGQAQWWLDPTSADFYYRAIYDYDKGVALERVAVADGNVQWSQPLPEAFESVDSLTLRANDKRVAVMTTEAVAIISEGGAPILVQQAETAFYPIGFDGDTLYLAGIKQRGTSTVTLFNVAAADGQVRWRSAALGKGISEAPQWALVPGQGVIVGWQDETNDDIVKAQLLGGDNKARWDFSDTLFIGYAPEIRLSNHLALIVASDHIAVVDARDGTIRWRIAD